MVRVPNLVPVGARKETIMTRPEIIVRGRERRSWFGPAGRLQGIAAAVVGEQAERVGRGAAPGGGEGEPGTAVVVERVGAFVHGSGLAGDGVRHFPLLGRGGDLGPGSHGPGVCVEGGDVDALDVAFGDGGADVVAAGADRQICAIDGPRPFAVGASLAARGGR